MGRISTKENIWKFTLVALILGIGLVLARQAWPYISGVLGALTLYILLRKPTFSLAEKTGRPTLAASIIVVCAVLFVAIPLSLFAWFIIAKLQDVNWNSDAIIAPAKQMIDILKDRYEIDIISEKNISFIAGKIAGVGQSIINGIGYFFIIALLLLFFLLTGGRKMEEYIASVIPMKNINKKETIDRINLMVKSNAIGIPLIAILQGAIAWIGYSIFGVPNAFLAAMATGLCSMIPIVGTMIVWVPLGIYFMVLGLWGKAIGLLLFCAVFVSMSDNLFRFILQKKMADTHPLITLFGVVAGIPLFGFMGIIFGPLLVSLFLLFIDMFRKEYLTENEPSTDISD